MKAEPAIMRCSILIGAMLIATGCAARADARASSDAHFFPTRPVGVKLETVRGVLTDFGIGNASGGLTIQRSGRNIDLYTAAAVRLDGKTIVCDHPPKLGKKRSIFCASWPAGVVLGRTTVSALYWLQRSPMSTAPVMVTDEIRTVR